MLIISPALYSIVLLQWRKQKLLGENDTYQSCSPTHVSWVLAQGSRLKIYIRYINFYPAKWIKRRGGRDYGVPWGPLYASQWCHPFLAWLCIIRIDMVAEIMSVATGKRQSVIAPGRREDWGRSKGPRAAWRLSLYLSCVSVSLMLQYRCDSIRLDRRLCW